MNDSNEIEKRGRGRPPLYTIDEAILRKKQSIREAVNRCYWLYREKRLEYARRYYLNRKKNKMKNDDI